MSTASTAPPDAATAGSNSPLSGPTNRAPDRPSTAIARRAVPTPGSTTARCTAPSGRYSIDEASTSAPEWTSWGGISWVRSITRASGQPRAITPWQTPTNPSRRP